jgi:hypothetical protein
MCLCLSLEGKLQGLLRRSQPHGTGRRDAVPLRILIFCDSAVDFLFHFQSIRRSSYRTLLEFRASVCFTMSLQGKAVTGKFY